MFFVAATLTDWMDRWFRLQKVVIVFTWTVFLIKTLANVKTLKCDNVTRKKLKKLLWYLWHTDPNLP